MAFVKAGTLSKLPAGSVMEAAIGDRRYAVCNVGGRVYALHGICPHNGGPLGAGAVHKGNVVCPWHEWQFDCATGAHDYNPSVKLATYPVEVRGDDILIDAGHS
jgi:nitrite reductase/ring-hydroxylating ferredoxin subunit